MNLPQHRIDVIDEWSDLMVEYGFTVTIDPLNSLYQFHDVDISVFLTRVLADNFLSDVEKHAIGYALAGKIGNASILDFMEISFVPGEVPECLRFMSDVVLFEGLWVENPELSPYPDLTELMLMIWDIMETYRSRFHQQMLMEIGGYYA